MEEINNTPTKKDFKKLYLGIAIGVVVLLVGFTLVLATGIWKPSWSPFQVNALKMFNSSVERISDLEYYHADLSIDVDIVDNGEEIGLEYDVFTDIDVSTEIPKSSTELTVGIISQGIKMILNAEAIEYGEVAYFKLKGIPMLIRMQLTALGIDISQYADKWYRFDPAELGISFDDDELAEGVRQAWNNHSVIRFVKRLEQEVINNENTYHYLFSIDEEEAKEYILDVLNLLQGGLADIPGTEFDEVYAELDKLFNAISPIEFEVWIGKSTHVLYKVRYKKYVDSTTLQAGGISVSQEDMEDIMDITAEFSISDLNIPKTITQPAESESLLELFMPIFEMFQDPSCIDGTCSY